MSPVAPTRAHETVARIIRILAHGAMIDGLAPKFQRFTRRRYNVSIFAPPYESRWRGSGILSEVGWIDGSAFAA
jgi:hypothetical protein